MNTRLRLAVGAVGLVAALGLTSAPAGASPEPESLPVLPHVIFYKSTTMAPSANPVELPRVPGRVSASYRFAGEQRNFDDYLRRASARGLVVLHDGKILDERYFSGYTMNSHFNSWSVGKSITSTAVGIAVGRGLIRSVDDPITRYLPELKGSGYNGVPIKHILQMSSGQRYDESTYTDPTQGATGTTIRMVLGQPLIDQARESVRVRPSGEKFNYASIDTFVLGRLVSKVTGQQLTRFVQDNIWKPAGMKNPTPVGEDYYGSTIAYASYHATTRDFARFGQLFMNDGVVRGRQVVPSAWVREATTPQSSQVRPGALYPHSVYGYGYQWWIGDGDRGDFMAVGILGQYVYVSPRDHVVIAQNSEDMTDDAHQEEALHAFRAVTDRITGRA